MLRNQYIALILLALTLGACASGSRRHHPANLTVLIEVQASEAKASWGGQTRYFARGLCSSKMHRQTLSPSWAAQVATKVAKTINVPIEIWVATEVSDELRRAITETLEAQGRTYRLSLAPSARPKSCVPLSVVLNPVLDGRHDRRSTLVGTSTSVITPQRFTSAQLKPIFKEASHLYQPCHAPLLRSDHSAWGWVGIAFVATPEGKVVHVEVIQDTIDPGTAKCVALQTTQIELPTTSGGRASIGHYYIQFATPQDP